MFYYSSIKKINLSSFNTIKVTDIVCMFYNCAYLKELNLSNFNTKNVTNMESMFSYCYLLKELNLFNFNTNNVIQMRYMFSQCVGELKWKIRNKYQCFRADAFEDKHYYYDEEEYDAM